MESATELSDVQAESLYMTASKRRRVASSMLILHVRASKETELVDAMDSQNDTVISFSSASVSVEIEEITVVNTFSSVFLVGAPVCGAPVGTRVVGSLVGVRLG